MKTSSINYLFKEGIKNIKINGTMSFASVIVMVCCLILTGVAMLLSINIKSTLNNIEKQNIITVYLGKNIKNHEIKAIGEQIAALSNIETSTYYSKDSALKEYKDVLGPLFEAFQGDENPLPEAFKVTMKDLSKYPETVAAIKAIRGIDYVSDRSKTAGRLTDLNRLIAKAGVWIVVTLGLVSLFIITNTINLTMYSRRHEISIMRSIGATNWFIRMPFLIEGVLIGLFSAVISIFLLNLVYVQLVKMINDIIPFKGVPFFSVSFNLLTAFLTAGVVFGLIGGLISISRYLWKEDGSIAKW